MGNILSHYELYNKIVELPGDVIELGVFKGGSLIQFCTFRELLENEKSRKIIGFDTFGEFPSVEKVESDSVFVDKWNKQFKDDFLSKDDLEKALASKGFGNVELVKGNILTSLDRYLDKFPYTRIALLHIDLDVYEPTKYGLEKLYDRVVRGGVIAFDDYGTVEGESIAIEEYFKDKDYELKKFRFGQIKPSYIIKHRWCYWGLSILMNEKPNLAVMLGTME